MPHGSTPVVEAVVPAVCAGSQWVRYEAVSQHGAFYQLAAAFSSVAFSACFVG